MSPKIKQIILFLAGTAGAIGVDQWTKALASAGLKNQPPYVIWEGVFELLYSENRGAAFGMLQGRQGFFFLVAAAVIVAAGFLMGKMPLEKRYVPLWISLMFIVSGAVGNMIDRIRLGYVVDFLYFSLIDFPIFNVADCYVTVATVCLIILLLFVYKEHELEVFSRKKKEESID